MPDISAEDKFIRQRVAVRDSAMAYVDTQAEAKPGGLTAVFLHGNPTSSYLWRNVIPHVAPLVRCLAPDLIGMGQSGKAPNGHYGFLDHAGYLDAWFDVLRLDRKIVLVLHDWGGGLGFHWAHRFPARVAAIAYMETLVCPVDWADWPANARNIFQALRSPAGEQLILEKNIFIEGILPGATLGGLSKAAHEVYRAPFRDKGEGRRPMLSWPRHIPIEGEPPAMVELVAAYGASMQESKIPKLFVNAEPGSILTGRARDFCRTWPNQTEVTVRGAHFIQEDSPDAIGQAVAGFVSNL
ncbi:MAG: haloalkane dehalogenase [Alphaproteobacteria bacterium]